MKNKTSSNFFIILFKCIMLIVVVHQAFAEDAPQKKNPAADNSELKAPDKNSIRKLPRYVLLPKLKWDTVPTLEGSKEVDFSKHRFWLIVVLGTWNAKSKIAAEILNQFHTELDMRNVHIFSLFSQDTIKSVASWKEKTKPLFETGFAATSFLDQLSNPKIPSVWLVGNKGQILQVLELPSAEDLTNLIKLALALTDF